MTEKIETKIETKEEPKKIPSKCRRWFFTIWKMDTDWPAIWEDFNDIIRCIVVQKEMGKKKGRLHWQGFIHMYDQCRLTKIRNLLNLGKGKNSAEIQRQKGTYKQAKTYCTKVETSQNEQYIFGKPSGQGCRTDWEHIKFMLKHGKRMIEIADSHFSDFVRYSKGIKAYQALIMQERARQWRDVDVTWISGPTGLNKTRKALNYNKTTNKSDPDVFKINAAGGLKWFDGYEGQKTLLIDEFKNQIEFCRLLDLLQGHSCSIEYKGGMTYALWDKVIITTNLRKGDIYPNITGELRAPLWRRTNQFISLWPIDNMDIDTAAPILETGLKVSEGNTGPRSSSHSSSFNIPDFLDGDLSEDEEPAEYSDDSCYNTDYADDCCEDSCDEAPNIFDIL